MAERGGVTSVTLVRRIAARPAIVFDALVDPAGIVRWWGPDAGPVLVVETDARIGGRFRVRFRMLDGTEHESSGEYLELIRPERLAMTWRWTTGGDDAGESRLAFALRAIEGGTELTLTHDRLESDSAAASHGEGWSGALDKLAASFEKEKDAA